MRRIGSHVQFRFEPIYADTDRLLAREKHMTTSEYLREEVVKVHLQTKTRERTAMQLGGAAMQLLSAPASDEVPIFLRKSLRQGKVESLLLCRNLSSCRNHHAT